MSDWHDEFTEPMHDTPADKDPLIAAMEAAGYTYLLYQQKLYGVYISFYIAVLSKQSVGI